MFGTMSWITPDTLSLEPSTARHAPIASIDAEAKNAVPCCSPEIILTSAIRMSCDCMISTQFRRSRSIADDKVRVARGPWSTISE